MHEIDKAWSQIIAWFEGQQPEVVNQLNAPATDADLAAAEAALGTNLPEDFKHLYRIADGSDVDIPSVFENGHWFMPLMQIIEHANITRQFLEGRPDEDFAFWRSQVEEGMLLIRGPVKPHTFSASWIPFTSSNGDVNRYVDLDPAPGGTAGQVIEVDAESAMYSVIADNLAGFLSAHAAHLQAGDFRIEHDFLVGPEAGGDWCMPAWLAGAEQSSTQIEAGDGEQVLTGAMGMLGGTGDEVFFTLHPDDDTEIACLATRAETKGFSQVRVEQDARVKLVKAEPGRQGFFGTPDYVVLEYKALR